MFESRERNETRWIIFHIFVKLYFFLKKAKINYKEAGMTHLKTKCLGSRDWYQKKNMKVV